MFTYDRDRLCTIGILYGEKQKRHRWRKVLYGKVSALKFVATDFQIMLSHIDHVQLAIPAGGEPVARTFYVDVLGCDEIPKPTELAKRGGAWFRCGDVALHLGVEEPFAAAKKAHPAFRCADYQSLLERLQRHGVAVTHDPIPFGGRPHCYIEDPFGNRLELIG